MKTNISEETRSFLIDSVLTNLANDYSKEDSEKLSILRREKVIKPTVFIETGTSGIASGAMETLEAVEKYIKDHSIDADIVEVGSNGFWTEEPILDVQIPGKARLSFGRVTADRVDDLLSSVLNKTVNYESILGQYKNPKQEMWANIPFIHLHPFFINQQRVILKDTGVISPHSIEDYIANGGYRSFYKIVLNYTPVNVCDLMEQSELRGRGGGGYLTGKKWKNALNTEGEQKYIICNAEESDPGAFMDRALAEGDPHRLLEGIAIAAYAVGAGNAYIYVRSDYSRAVNILREAIRQAKEYNILGQNVFESGFSINIHIVQSAGAFVCGEETALIRSLESKRGMPWSKPPYPTETGLFNRPTVVNNVETLVNVPAIVENGPAWFRTLGSPSSRGTKLFSLAGKVNRKGFIEVPMGTTFRDIVYEIGNGAPEGRKIKAIQIGGPLGICLPESRLDVSTGFESLRELGATIFSGGLVILDEKVCMVHMTKYYMDFLRNETCGKCIPCREGTRRIYEILEAITRKPREESNHETLERFKGVVQLENLANVIHDTSLCGLGQNASNPVLSALKWFREEFEEHIFDRRCATGTCRGLRTFRIDPDSCNGCNICQKKCPENAIIGVPKNPHFIVDEKCTGCGICFESCKFNAIFIK
ncbi:MAG: NADH-ubiquinone oxidoreductase-F iron-sulfur binding region domain-containing protein [Bacteroidota bacterium]|nr:NADH-ubiquinone oxidoreductase-F iron-sulfur binding region domain-containing protein [Bacteroidota bacterium]